MEPAVSMLNESGRWLVAQLGRMSVELAILAGIVFVALYVLRVKSPALRHLFWGLLLAKPVVTFLVASPLSLYAVLWPPAPAIIFTAPPVTVQAEPAPPPVRNLPMPEVVPSAPAPLPKAPPFWRQIDRYGLASAVWMLAASALGLRLLLGCAYVTFLRGTAKTQREGIMAELVTEAAATLRVRRRVAIATTTVCHGPVLAGIFRPVILLPETMAAALTNAQLKLVITHELAHAKRWDNLVLLVQRLAEMFFFFHPVVWFCGWMMRREAEAACDDMVVSACADADIDGAAAYADSLTRVAEMKCGITRRLLVNTFAAAESNFHRRVQRILSGRRTRMTVWLSLATGAALILIGVMGLPAASSPKDAGTNDKNGFVLIPRADTLDGTVLQKWQTEGLVSEEQIEQRLREETVSIIQTRFKAEQVPEYSFVELPGGAIRVDVKRPEDRIYIPNMKQCAARPGHHNFHSVADADALHAALEGLKNNDRLGKSFLAVLNPPDKETGKVTIPMDRSEEQWRILLKINGTPGLLPDGMKLATWLDRDPSGQSVRELLLMKREPALKDLRIKNVAVTRSQGGMPGYDLAVTPSPDEAAALEDFTRANIGRRIACAMEAAVWSAPLVSGPISGSWTVATGLPETSARTYAATLMSGPLPAALDEDTAPSGDEGNGNAVKAKEDIEAKWDGINSYTATIESANDDKENVRRGYTMHSRVWALKNADGVLMYRIETDKATFGNPDRKGFDKLVMVYDGKDVYRETQAADGIEVRVRKNAQDVDFSNGAVGLRRCFEQCFQNETVSLLPEEEVGGKGVYVFEGRSKRSKVPPPYRLYIDKETGFQLKFERGHNRSVLNDVKVNVPVDPALFKYTPPDNAKVVDSAAPERAAAADGNSPEKKQRLYKAEFVVISADKNAPLPDKDILPLPSDASLADAALKAVSQAAGDPGGSSGHVELLSSPSMMLVEGERGSIVVGQDIPMPTSDASVADAVAQKFAGCSISTAIAPEDGSDEIGMDLHVEITKQVGLASGEKPTEGAFPKDAVQGGTFDSHLKFPLKDGRLVKTCALDAQGIIFVAVRITEAEVPVTPVGTQAANTQTAAQDRYTHLVTFEPAGDFHPEQPGELLDVFNGVCAARTGYFRTAPLDGKLVGRICTDAPEELRKSIEKEPRLKWIKTEPLTPELFAQQEARQQRSLPEKADIEKALDAPVSVEFENTHLGEIVNFITDSYNINIGIDWRAVAPPPSKHPAKTGPDRVTEGSIPYISLKNVALRDALNALVRPLNLAFKVEPSLVWISSPALMEADAKRPQPDLKSASENLAKAVARPVSIEFEDVHLSEIVGFISDSYDVNFVLDDRVMPRKPRTPDEPPQMMPAYVTDGMVVRVNLRNTPLAEALRALLRPLNLTFAVEPGFLWISSDAVIKTETPPQAVPESANGSAASSSAPATAAALPPVAAENFVATLPDGRSIQLLSVREHRTDNKSFWRPDGTSLAEAAYDPDKLAESVAGQGKAYEFAFRTKGIESDEPMQYRFEGSTGWAMTGSSDNLATSIATVCLDAKATTENISVSVASGDWTTLITEAPLDGNGGSARGAQEYSVIFGATYEKDGAACVTVTLEGSLSEQAVRLCAVDAQGQLHPSFATGCSAGKARQTAHSFAGMKPQDIREFQLQTRPWQEIQFNNVSLTPDKHTDVKVLCPTVGPDTTGKEPQNQKWWGEGALAAIGETIAHGRPELPENLRAALTKQPVTATISNIQNLVETLSTASGVSFAVQDMPPFEAISVTDANPSQIMEEVIAKSGGKACFIVRPYGILATSVDQARAIPGASIPAKVPRGDVAQYGETVTRPALPESVNTALAQQPLTLSGTGPDPKLSTLLEMLSLSSKMSFALQTDVVIKPYAFNGTSAKDIMLAISDITRGQVCFVLRDYGFLVAPREAAQRLEGASIPEDLPFEPATTANPHPPLPDPVKQYLTKEQTTFDLRPSSFYDTGNDGFANVLELAAGLKLETEYNVLKEHYVGQAAAPLCWMKDANSLKVMEALVEASNGELCFVFTGDHAATFTTFERGRQLSGPAVEQAPPAAASVPAASVPITDSPAKSGTGDAVLPVKEAGDPALTAKLQGVLSAKEQQIKSFIIEYTLGQKAVKDQRLTWKNDETCTMALDDDIFRWTEDGEYGASGKITRVYSNYGGVTTTYQTDPAGGNGVGTLGLDWVNQNPPSSAVIEPRFALFGYVYGQPAASAFDVGTWEGSAGPDGSFILRHRYDDYRERDFIFDSAYRLTQIRDRMVPMEEQRLKFADVIARLGIENLFQTEWTLEMSRFAMVDGVEIPLRAVKTSAVFSMPPNPEGKPWTEETAFPERFNDKNTTVGVVQVMTINPEKSKINPKLDAADLQIVFPEGTEIQDRRPPADQTAAPAAKVSSAEPQPASGAPAPHDAAQKEQIRQVSEMIQQYDPVVVPVSASPAPDAKQSTAEGKPASGPLIVAPLIGYLDDKTKADWQVQGINGDMAVLGRLQDQTLEIMQKRLDSAGMKDVKIAKEANGRISVQIPPSMNLTRASLLLTQPGMSRFCPAASRDEVIQALQEIEKNPSFQGRLTGLFDTKAKNDFLTVPTDKHAAAEAVVGEINDARPRLLPEAKMFFLGSKSSPNSLYLIDKNSPMANVKVKSASATPDTDNPGKAKISFSFSDEDAQRFGDLTQSLVGKGLAILINWEVQSVPIVRSKITQSGQIVGNYTLEEAADIAARISVPEYPAQLLVLSDPTATPGNPEPAKAEDVRKALETRYYGGIDEGLWNRLLCKFLVPVFDPATGEELSLAHYDNAKGELSVRNLPDNLAAFEVMITHFEAGHLQTESAQKKEDANEPHVTIKNSSNINFTAGKMEGDLEKGRLTLTDNPTVSTPEVPELRGEEVIIDTKDNTVEVKNVRVKEAQLAAGTESAPKGWHEDFERYASGTGTWPEGWIADGNATRHEENYVDGAKFKDTHGNTLRLQGDTPAWSPLAHIKTGVGVPFRIACDVYLESKDPKCTCVVGVRKEPSWKAPGVILFDTIPPGEVNGLEPVAEGGMMSKGQTFDQLHMELAKWYRVELVLREEQEKQSLSVTLNDGTSVQGPVQLTTDGVLVEDMPYLQLEVRSGTAWFDNVSMTSIEMSPQATPVPQKVSDTTILPGRGLKEVGVGDTEQAVHEKLGEPDGVDHSMQIYRRHGLDVVFKDNAVIRMRFRAAFPGKTAEGVGIGSSMDDAIRASGGAVRTVQNAGEMSREKPMTDNRVLYELGGEGKPAGYRFTDSTRGVFYMADREKKITNIIVSRPAQEADPKTDSEAATSAVQPALELPSTGAQEAVFAQTPSAEEDRAPQYTAEMKLLAGPRKSVDSLCAGLKVDREIEHGPEAERVFSTGDERGIEVVFAASDKDSELELLSAPRVTFKAAEEEANDKDLPATGPLKIVLRAESTTPPAPCEEMTMAVLENNFGDYSASLLNFFHDFKPTAVIMDAWDCIPKHSNSEKVSPIKAGIAMAVRLDTTGQPDEFGLKFYFNNKDALQASRGLAFWKPIPPAEIFELPVVVRMNEPNTYRLGEWVVVATKNRDPKKATLALLHIERAPSSGARFFHAQT